MFLILSRQCCRPELKPGCVPNVSARIAGVLLLRQAVMVMVMVMALIVTVTVAIVIVIAIVIAAQNAS